MISARADVMLADQAWDRTRIRAPMAGSILQINARIGELIAASPEQVIFAMGDMSRLRVRAEVEDTEVSKMRVGGSVGVRNSAFPARSSRARSPKCRRCWHSRASMHRSPRRPTDVEVMEVIIELDNAGGLLPGMRVEAFFR